MIVNTELEQKGNLFPSEIVSYKKDVDTLYFTTKNNVVLQLTVVRDSVISIPKTTKKNAENSCKDIEQVLLQEIASKPSNSGSCYVY